LDVLEYHSVAFNFAEFGKFPLMGFVTDPAEYRLDRLTTDPAEDYVRCRFEAHGPVLYFAKPPLFPLLLGVTYMFLGSDLQNAYWLNFFLFIICCAFLYLSGRELSYGHGRLLGLGAIFIFSIFFPESLSDVLPSVLGSTVLAACMYWSIRLCRHDSLIIYALLGVSFGLILLGKGNLMFIILLTPAFILVQNGFSRYSIAALTVLVLSAVSVVLPWSFYANHMAGRDRETFERWSNKVVAAENMCTVDTSFFPEGAKLDMVRRGEHHRTMTRFFTRYANVDSRFIVSNQFSTDELLSVHNNLCVDGHWHPEWTERDTCIYNTKYLNKAPLGKIAAYYVDEPDKALTIASKKFARTIDGGGVIWLYTAFIYGLFLIQNVLPKRVTSKVLGLMVFVSIAGLIACSLVGHMALLIYVSAFFFSGSAIQMVTGNRLVPFIFPLATLNVYLTVLVFYGDPRFADIIQPASVLGGLYVLYLLVSQLVGNPVFFCHNYR
jgi:4-amino-4-deoxy-L-arabinose transferase-like glycosyltransferase